MADRKKGARKIIVNDEEYIYFVKFVRIDCGVLPINIARVTIKSPAGKYYISREEKVSVAPSYVRELIETYFLKK